MPAKMIVEVRHLETLSAIAATGSLTRAAKRVHLTLSAVSHQLSELEALLGVSLVDRRSKPLELTAAGSRLLGCAEIVLPALRAAEADLATIAGTRAGRLYLALECHSCFEWLLPALDALREAWPDLDVDLRLGPRFDPIPALLAREVDAVVGTDRVEREDVRYQGLFRYEIVLVVGRGHRLWGREWVEASELAGEPLVTYPVELERLDVVTRFLRPNGVEPVQSRSAELTSVLLQLVRSRRGAAALPAWALGDAVLRGELASLRLGRAGLFSELFLASRESDATRPELRAFYEIARRTSAELLPAVELSS